MTENPPTPEAGKDGKSLPVVDSPAAPPAISPVESTHKTVELFTKIFVVVAAVLYVTGFLVVSLHLARYGIHSFSILRAQYILAGAWFFAHILFIAPIVLLPRMLTKVIKAKRVLEGLSYILELTTLFVVGGCLYFLLFYSAISIFNFDNIIIFDRYYIPILIALWGGHDIYNKLTTLKHRRILVSIYVGLACLVFFWTLTEFSRDVYSIISAEYGGGKPVKVQFHWKDECKTKDIAATFQKECKLKEEPVFFDQILATDTDHVIISPCPKIYPRTFEISNDLIDYVEIKYEQKKDIKL